MKYNYKIILDSCGEIPAEFENDERFARVALSIEVGDYRIIDDETFDQKKFLQKVFRSLKKAGYSRMLFLIEEQKHRSDQSRQVRHKSDQIL